VYRYPFVDEQVSYLGFLTDQFNTNLEAEAGTDMQFGADVAVSRTVRAGLTLFLMNMRDEIAFNPATWNNENLDKTRHSGAEANVAWAAMDDLAVDAGYTYTEAVFTSGVNDGRDIPLVPRNTATIGVTLSLPFDLSLRTAARYTGAQRLGGDYANAGEQLPSYTVADLLLRYTPRSAEGLDAFIAVDNVFGEKYAGVGYMGMTENGYYPAPERAFRAGASYRF
jgi:iron complex outermembrane recepter protein